jgi:ketosteroid isomerase-like protein
MSAESEMSPNVDRLRELYEADNARDIEAFIAHCDPAIELETAFAAVGGEVYHGHEQLRCWQRDVAEIWRDDVRTEPEAYFDLGERVLAFHVLHGRGEQSGVAVAMPVALVARWRDGLVVYLKAYAHREDALRDLGVGEAELEPIAP